MNPSVKLLLYQQCLALADQRIQTAREAMNSAQAAANEEGKNSAGDKYETGRAMMQLERDQHARALAEAQKLKQALENIDPQRSSAIVQPGSLVHTSMGNFYIAISLGRLQLAGTEYMAISPQAPIGALLMGKREGDRLEFNRKQIEVLQLY
jgi:transcription elongation GreA/GreB family factor